jgi:hypothetical protein
MPRLFLGAPATGVYLTTFRASLVISEQTPEMFLAAENKRTVHRGDDSRELGNFVQGEPTIW